MHFYQVTWPPRPRETKDAKASHDVTQSQQETALRLGRQPRQPPALLPLSLHFCPKGESSGHQPTPHPQALRPSPAICTPRLLWLTLSPASTAEPSARYGKNTDYISGFLKTSQSQEKTPQKT